MIICHKDFLLWVSSFLFSNFRFVFVAGIFNKAQSLIFHYNLSIFYSYGSMTYVSAISITKLPISIYTLITKGFYSIINYLNSKTEKIHFIQ